MATKNQQQQPAEAAKSYVYPGPYPQVVLRNLPEVGDVTFDRGKPVDLPASVGDELVKRKKLKAARASIEGAPAEQ